MTAADNTWSRFTLFCHQLRRKPAPRATFYFGLGCLAPSVMFMVNEADGEAVLAWLNEHGTPKRGRSFRQWPQPVQGAERNRVVVVDFNMNLSDAVAPLPSPIMSRHQARRLADWLNSLTKDQSCPPPSH